MMIPGCVIGQVEVHCSHPDLDYVMRSRYQHLERIFYLSDDGIPTRLRGQVGLGGDGQEDMLSLTIKVTSENFMNQKVEETMLTTSCCLLLNSVYLHSIYAIYSCLDPA